MNIKEQLEKTLNSIDSRMTNINADQDAKATLLMARATVLIGLQKYENSEEAE